MRVALGGPLLLIGGGLIFASWPDATTVIIGIAFATVGWLILSRSRSRP